METPGSRAHPSSGCLGRGCDFSGPQGASGPSPATRDPFLQRTAAQERPQGPWAVPERGRAAGAGFVRGTASSPAVNHQFPALGPSGPPAHFPLPLNCFLGVTPGTGSLVGEAVGSGLAAHSGECEPSWGGRGAGLHEAEHWGAPGQARPSSCKDQGVSAQTPKRQDTHYFLLA